MNPSKDKGTRKETTAKRYLQASGWPEADRQPQHGVHDQGDLLVCRNPRIIAEVKGGAQAEDYYRSAAEALLHVQTRAGAA